MYSGAIDATIGSTEHGVATVTRPAPERNAPSADKCAAPVFPRDPATIVSRPKSPLCESAALGSMRSLLGGQQLDVPSVDAVDDVLRNADVGNDDIAGVLFTGRKNERQLGRRERNRHRRVDAVTDDVRGIGGQPARQIDRHDGDRRRVHIGDDRLHHAAQGRLQTGAEDRVHDQRAL
jgi:hypothetical protein